MLERQGPGEERAAVEAGAAAATRPRRHGWLGALVAGIALVALVAAFGAFALARGGLPGGAKGAAKGGGGGSSAAVTLPKDWQTYHDPLGLFTIHVPSAWTATVFTGPGEIRGPNGSMKWEGEEVTLDDPAQGGAVEIQVSADQITNAFGRQWYCGPRAQETLLFNGYPASAVSPLDPPGSTWLLESSNAHFQIDTSIAGVMTPSNAGGGLNPPPTPTAPPQATVTADHAILATALASFRPTTGPLTC